MDKGERKLVRVEGRVKGHVRRTLGGFYRASNYAAGFSMGPFATEEIATQWVIDGIWAASPQLVSIPMTGNAQETN